MVLDTLAGLAPSSAEQMLMFALLTNAINILLVFCVAAAPWLPPQRQAQRKPAQSAGQFWRRSVLGIGLAVILAESGKHFSVWPGRPTFPSGHETLALAAGTCLVLRSPRWLALALPLAAVQAWALVAGHFHRPVDVAGALATGILPPLACFSVKAGKRQAD